mmetsp:Transcript_38163/g.123481  ORF Transcript_38163/g.123481 Transcript_38163/m.123481 type:complete len:272 (-) Transcript_38163:648-1463(-)
MALSCFSLRALQSKSSTPHCSSSASIRCSSDISSLATPPSSCPPPAAAAAAAAAASASLASRSLRSSSRISAMISSPRASSSATASAPRATVAQSTSCSAGTASMLSVARRPAATPLAKAPSVSASNAPTERAQRALPGESTSMVGKSVSPSPKAATKSVWHVASSHEYESGPPAPRLRSLASTASCASLFPLSGPPSRRATAQSPPRCVHSASKLAAESSGGGPTSLPAPAAFLLPPSPSPPAGLAPSACTPSICSRCSATDATNAAMLP